MLTSRVCMLVAQLCSTLCDPMDYSSPGSSVHGILQARILEWVAMPFSRGSIQPRDGTQVSRMQADSLSFFTILIILYQGSSWVCVSYHKKKNKKQL